MVNNPGVEYTTHHSTPSLFAPHSALLTQVVVVVAGGCRRNLMPETMEVEHHFARRRLSFLCRRPILAAPDLVAKTILDVAFLG